MKRKLKDGIRKIKGKPKNNHTTKIENHEKAFGKLSVKRKAVSYTHLTQPTKRIV